MEPSSDSKTVLNCDYCGDEFEKYTYRITDGNNFCSKDCRVAFQQEDNHYELCSNCGDDVKIPPSRRKGEYGDYHLENHFCDKECESEWKSENWVGEKHPNYKENTVVLEFEECGAEYTTHKSAKKTSRFCSRGCQNSNYAADHVTKDCDNCGKEVSRPQWRFKGENAFCSKTCYGEWWSEQQRGSGNPAWKGGRSGITAVRRMLGSQSWDKTAREVRAGAGRICEKCGEFQPHRELSAHHIIPVASGGTNGHWNLMALCESCHGVVEEYTKTFTEPHLLKYVPTDGGEP